jgi:hypothetical protein
MLKSSKSGRGFTGKLVKKTGPANKKRRQGILQPILLIQLIQPIHTKTDKVVSASATRNLLSTRAGGQDDVSSQANPLKLYYPTILLWPIILDFICFF